VLWDSEPLHVRGFLSHRLALGQHQPLHAPVSGVVRGQGRGNSRSTPEQHRTEGRHHRWHSQPRGKIRVDSATSVRSTLNVNKAIALFLTCVLSPLLAFADAEFDALKAMAEKGDVEAQFQLSAYYNYGTGTTQDHLKAVEWCLKAANQGHTTAQLSMGAFYASGKGVPKDTAKAIDWFQKAADKGDAEGQTRIGTAYYLGLSVTKNASIGVEWFEKAAKQGHPLAQSQLGFAYAEGVGCVKNYLLAYVWLNLALSQGNENSKNTLATIESRMTREQIAEAQKLSVTYAELIKQGKPLPTQ
jgi:hypothetical protein